MNQEKNIQDKYFRFGIIVILWLLLIGGLSYAYFSIAFNNEQKTTVEVESGKLSVDFETGQYIVNESMWPIDDDDIFEKGDKSTFSIKRSPDNTTNNVYYDIWLDDIEITSNYKSQYVKWKLYSVQNPNESSIPVSEGSFVNIGNRTSVQLTSQKISLPDNVTHNYTLYLWISNSKVDNQIELLEGNFKGRIKIEAVTQ